jgi:hypothetical protein
MKMGKELATTRGKPHSQKICEILNIITTSCLYEVD